MPSRIAASLLLAFALGACRTPKLQGKGGPCHSLSDCKPGLACIEERCSSDLESIEGDVPEYQEPAADAQAEASPPDGG